jgi:hypothetical protein
MACGVQGGETGGTMKYLFVMILVLVIGCSGVLVGEEKAIEAMEGVGLSNVQIKNKHIVFVGYHGCGDSDDVAFEAVGNKGSTGGGEVMATVCCGAFFKGCTVRF